MFKRVVAYVSEKQFYRFLNRVKSEGLNIGDVLASMVIVYGNGGEIKIPSHKEKEIKDAVCENQYLRDHRSNRT